MGALARSIYEMKTLIARFPALALPAQRVRGRGELLEDDTEVVIESFPRCASSFAVAAFRLAQEPHASRIAHHTHMPAQVIAACRRGVPTLVLTRAPEDAVLSHVLFTRGLTPRASLRGYLRFYEPLLAYRSRFVVGTFDEVIASFGGVVERLNARFATTFVPFEHEPENVRRIEREIESDYGGRAGTPDDLARTLPLPRDERAARKEDLRAEYRSTPAVLRGRAEAAFVALRPDG